MHLFIKHAVLVTNQHDGVTIEMPIEQVQLEGLEPRTADGPLTRQQQKDFDDAIEAFRTLQLARALSEFIL